MTLGEFLKREAGSQEPWNCSTLPADWCISLGHPDFARRWRHIVTNKAIKRATRHGLVRLWHRGILRSMPIITAPYQTGDVAIVAAYGHEAGAIFTGQRWALRMQIGVMFVAPDQVNVLKAWRP